MLLHNIFNIFVQQRVVVKILLQDILCNKKEEKLRLEKANKILYFHEPNDLQSIVELKWNVIDHWQTHPGLIEVIQNDYKKK